MSTRGRLKLRFVPDRHESLAWAPVENSDVEGLKAEPQSAMGSRGTSNVGPLVGDHDLKVADERLSASSPVLQIVLKRVQSEKIRVGTAGDRDVRSGGYVVCAGFCSMSAMLPDLGWDTLAANRQSRKNWPGAIRGVTLGLERSGLGRQDATIDRRLGGQGQCVVSWQVQCQHLAP